jgi:hypothetical protein
VPSVAGDFGGGHSELNHREAAACRRSQGGGPEVTPAGLG